MRGDVHLLRAPWDARGHEQRGPRYAVVLQSDYLAGNHSGRREEPAAGVA